jgi:hypothetical protein
VDSIIAASVGIKQIIDEIRRADILAICQAESPILRFSSASFFMKAILQYRKHLINDSVWQTEFLSGEVATKRLLLVASLL